MEEARSLYAELSNAIAEGEPEEVETLTRDGLAQGMDPLAIINQGLMPGINEVGDNFATGLCFLPDLIMAGEAMTAGIAVLKPALEARDAEIQSSGKVLIGTVKGDIHEIGKNLVATMFTAAGFQVVDLGVDVPVLKFVDEVAEQQPDLIGMSALLTTTMGHQQRVIEGLIEAGLRDRVKVMIGGAPITAQWAEEIGSDGYAGNAIEAVLTARKLLGIDGHSAKGATT